MSGTNQEPRVALATVTAPIGMVNRWSVGKEALLVAALLLSLELIFIPYYAGWAIPPLDFLSSYTTDAYQWWWFGDLLTPPQWLPWQWNGYPAAMSIQSGSWYLPVGLAATITAYTPHVAAIVQAAHVGWGALGGYVLARRTGLGRGAGALVLSAYFFAPGFFSGAAHADLVRGWAWLPWLMLICSPRWPWHRRGAVPLAAVVIWQALVGIYPGQIVAFAYALLVWVVSWLVTMRAGRRAFAIRLAASGLVAIALAAPKYLPLVWLQSRNFSSPDHMVVDLTTLASVVLPHEGLAVSHDPSMSVFWVPAVLLVFLVAADRRARCFWPAAGMLMTSAALGLPFLPTYDIALPGLQLSRFQMNDFRAALILSVILVAATGAQSAMTAAAPPVRRLAIAGGLLIGGVMALAFIVAPPHAAIGMGFVIISAAAACAMPSLRARVWLSTRTRWLVLAVIVSASGCTFALLSTSDWGQGRAATERFHYGHTASELLAGTTVRDDALTRRPARWLPPAKPKPGLMEPLLDTAGNAAVYAHEFAVYGYSNLRNSDTVAAMTAAYHDPAQQQSFLRFYGAPGALAPIDGDGLLISDGECLTRGSCADTAFSSVRYAPGSMTFSIQSDAGGPIAVNESYYPGWQATLCSAALRPDCRTKPVRQGPMGSIAVNVPAGSSTLKLTYETPGLTLGLLVFWGAVACLVLSLVLGPAFRERWPQMRGRARRWTQRSSHA